MGLAISRQILQAHQGDIRAEPSALGGLKVTISLPQGTVMSRILIAEDEQDIRQLLVDYLQQSGYTTVAVDNGNDALSQARTEQPDLVLLDVMMPGLDGLEVCRQLREVSHVPVIFITARHDEVESDCGLAHGRYDDYIVNTV